MKIVTGVGEAEHVTAEEHRALVEGIVGQDSCILNVGNQLEVEILSNNLLKINSGMMVHHGNVSWVKEYDEVTLSNGTQGSKRIDLVVNRYTKNTETLVEENEWVVHKGTAAAEDPVAPSYVQGDLRSGSLIDDCPVFEVEYDGLNIVEVRTLLDVAKSSEELQGTKITSHILNETTNLDYLLENGMYYAFDDEVIRSTISVSGIAIPVEMEDYSAYGLFVEVYQGMKSGSPSDVVGQPTQHVRVYYINYAADSVYEYSYDRAHTLVGSYADGSSWGLWRTANTQPDTEENIVYLYNDDDYERYSYELDIMTEAGTYFMSLNDTMRKKYPSLFTPLDGYSAVRAIMEVAEMEKEGSMVYAQTMTILFPVVENGVSTFKTMTASRINYGEPGMRTWKTSVGDLMSSTGGNEVFYIASVSDFAKYENGFDSMTTPGTYFIYPKLAGIADTYPELFTPKDGYTATVAVMEVGTYEEGSTDALHQFMTIYFPVTVNGESTLETMTATRINLGESGMRTWKISKGDLSNIFIAEYGTTALDEILGSLSSGKSCFCNYGNTLMSLISYGPASVQFGCFAMSNARGESAFYTIVTVNSSGWIKPEVTKYTKTSEISESSTDDEVPTALAVQKTRTHYTENEGQTTVILEETDLGETDDFFTLEQALPFEVGKTYVITWNGTEYECKAKNYAIEGAPFVGVGNASLLSLGKDTGEPFAMGTLDSLTMIAPAGAVEGTSDGTVEPVYVSAVVSIVQIDEVVHKLPNKYLDLEWSPVRKVVLKTLLEETELAIYKADIGIEMPYVGDTVYVTIDGTEYETVTKEIWLNGTSGIVFGNPALVNDSLENTGEIFVAWATGAEVVWICSGTAGVKRTVSIKADVHEYVALPKEFMPTYAIETDLADGVTADELSSANAYFKKGVPVYALVNGTKGKILNLTMYTDDAEHTCSHVWVVVKDKLYNLYYVGSALTNAYEISQTEVTL